jgi:NAD(P)-dependent dehydrogenase (short-subunit alcohol dehydrogenase family)
VGDVTAGLDLRGQVAVVTGGSVGIGRATCVALGAAGAHVVIVGRNRTRIDEALREIGHDAHLGLTLDVRSEADMDALPRAVLDRFGRLDVLVAAAGILRPPGSSLKTLVQTPLDEWDVVVGTNLRGMFLSNRAVLPAMIAQRSGQIVNVSSTSGRKAYAFDTAYCASKYGIIGLTEALADEVRPYGVRVQAVLPGAIETPMWEQNGPLRRPHYALPPERVADVILYMLGLPEDAMLANTMIEPVGRPAQAGWRAAGAEGP